FSFTSNRSRAFCHSARETISGRLVNFSVLVLMIDQRTRRNDRESRATSFRARSLDKHAGDYLLRSATRLLQFQIFTYGRSLSPPHSRSLCRPLREYPKFASRKYCLKVFDLEVGPKASRLGL